MKTTLATGNRQTQRRDGFTLIELSLVVMILALVLALAAPNFVRSYRSALLGETARTFATNCQLARLHAVCQQRNTTLHIDLDRQAYWITQVATNAEMSLEPVTVKWVDVGPRIALASATIADDTRHGLGNKLVEINFYPNGTCDGAVVAFRGRDEKETITMALDPITARAVPVSETQ